MTMRVKKIFDFWRANVFCYTFYLYMYAVLSAFGALDDHVEGAIGHGAALREPGTGRKQSGPTRRAGQLQK